MSTKGHFASDFHQSLVSVLNEALTKSGGYLQLSTLISDYSQSKRKLDRRKLKRIVDGDANVCLDFRELAMIDRWLKETRHTSLAELLKIPTIPDQLRKGSKLAVIVGSHSTHEPGSSEVVSVTSRWDLLSISNHILPSLYSQASTSHPAVMIHDAHLPPRGSLVGGTINSDRFENEEWYEALKHTPCCLVVASQRSNVATELFLSKIFGVRPFGQATEDEKASLPFAMLWSEAQMNETPSSFAEVHKSGGENNWRCQGLRFGKKAYRISRSSDQWTTWGVLVGAKLKGRFLFGCVGATGPATLACAERMKMLKVDGSWPEKDKTLVFYNLVKVEVERQTASETDNRTIVGSEVKYKNFLYWK